VTCIVFFLFILFFLLTAIKANLGNIVCSKCVVENMRKIVGLGLRKLSHAKSPTNQRHALFAIVAARFVLRVNHFAFLRRLVLNLARGNKYTVLRVIQISVDSYIARSVAPCSRYYSISTNVIETPRNIAVSLLWFTVWGTRAVICFILTKVISRLIALPRV
jgi:hypothetical protein